MYEKSELEEKCAICGRNIDEVERLIEGPEGYICSYCIRLYGIINDEIERHELGI